MTKETFEYTVETCDICKRRVKKEAKKKEHSPWINLTSYSISSGTWFAHSGIDAEPLPEHIDMCNECNESFKQWRDRRQVKCECGHNDP